MKVVEQRLPQDFDKSFIVFEEVGHFFPCPWHYHPEYELVLVCRSTGRRMVGDHIGYFDEGDLVFMGPAIPHVWVNDLPHSNQPTDHAAAVVIQFTDNFLGENFFNIPEMDDFKNFLRLSSRGMAIQGKCKKAITEIMQKMSPMNGIQRISALFSIFDLLTQCKEYELLASPTYANNIQVKCSDRFSKITDYIMRNFDRDIALPQIAEISNMGVTTFCNFFKEHYRMSFVEYLNTVRIGHACKLLSENDQNIVQVAYDCGFNNLANFNRQFKRLKNMTPSEYRILVA